MTERRKPDRLQSLLMLLLSVVIAYAVWQNQTMYNDIKSDVKDIKVAFIQHAKDQAACEKRVDTKIACLEQAVYGKVYAEENLSVDQKNAGISDK